MKLNVCGNCKYYATRKGDERRGSCMARAKQIDGHWGYHPEREFNHIACGFFKVNGRETYDIKQR